MVRSPAAIGKWHLGHLPEFLPTNHGFDSYFGIPYSNDMDRVGEIMKALGELDLANRTLVFFTSDNGPWLVFDEQGGSTGLLREGKGTTWEGGMREPAIAWWPGTIPAGTVNTHLASTMDLLPTAAELAGVEVPRDRVIDGTSLLPLLTGRSDAPVHDAFFYYRGEALYAARVGPWKAHFITEGAYAGGAERVIHEKPELYHLEHDPSERYNVAADHPDVIEEIRRAVEQHEAGLVRVPTRLEARIGE